MGDAPSNPTPLPLLIPSLTSVAPIAETDRILSLSKWQYVVAKHIRELSQDTGTTTFEELRQNINVIAAEADSLGLCSLRLLSKTLKELRDINFIRLCGNEYVLLDHRSTLRAAERCTSRGEREIARCLRGLGVGFAREKSLRGMVFTNPLRLDFYFELGGERCAIEYDGRHHTIPHPRTGGVQGLRLTKLRDKAKNAFCSSNGIRLLRIPYTKFPHIKREITNFVRNVRRSRGC